MCKEFLVLHTNTLSAFFVSFVCAQLSLEELKVRHRYCLNTVIVFKDHSAVEPMTSRSPDRLFSSSTVPVRREDDLVERSSAQGARLCRASEFQDCGECVFCVHVWVGVCSLLGTREQQIPTLRVPMIRWPSAKRLLLSCCIVLITQHICLHLL